jgi:hypothetical protein
LEAKGAMDSGILQKVPLWMTSTQRSESVNTMVKGSGFATHMTSLNTFAKKLLKLFNTQIITMLEKPIGHRNKLDVQLISMVKFNV